MGSIGHPVAVSSISVIGATSASGYFGYDGSGYYPVITVEPGHGYWLKMNGNGTLSLTYPSAASKQRPATDMNALNKITIMDATGRQQSLFIGEESTVREPLNFFELPPAAPGFDVRYASGRMLETYPTSLENQGVYEYPIDIKEATYPVTVRWEAMKT